MQSPRHRRGEGLTLSHQWKKRRPLPLSGSCHPTGLHDRTSPNIKAVQDKSSPKDLRWSVCLACARQSEQPILCSQSASSS